MILLIKALLNKVTTVYVTVHFDLQVSLIKISSPYVPIPLYRNKLTLQIQIENFKRGLVNR